MASDYTIIRSDNERRYGTDVGEYGPILLADRYDNRAHFIYELLQNAEDALNRRANGNGKRSVLFKLSRTNLSISHYGEPFDEADVRGISGIARSTKDSNSIGRFGIGFKSVYAFTDSPEIHSGQEDFAIENFVWPIAVPAIDRQPDETLIILPLKVNDTSAVSDITFGLQQLGVTTLLFLKQIEEIEWCVENGPSGLYLRSKPEILSEGICRINVIGQEEGKPQVVEKWIVFSRQVTNENSLVGSVEIAFALSKQNGEEQEAVKSLKNSPLVVFFPTVLETHLGFLVQGPYRTTPSRDNVPRKDPWNQHCLSETTTLLLEALCWMRDNDLLGIEILQCLPLESGKFGESAIFSPMFSAVKNALLTESLLPQYNGSYVAAANARLARTQELRELFNPDQLAMILGTKEKLFWLSGDITHERTPELRKYLIQELGIPEVTPESIIVKLNKEFLESQEDSWILQLYEFLNGQPALRRRIQDLPIIRLDNGLHVVPQVDGRNQAFLPGAIITAFPTVQSNVCSTAAALEFLLSLGLTEPDPVDDVIWNILPNYQSNNVDVSNDKYETDIRRILTAFSTDSKTQREKLVVELRKSYFVKAINCGDGSKCVAKPGDVYIATERLKELFAGVQNVILVDIQYSYLRGEDIRELLESCGSTRYLQTVQIENTFSDAELSQIRRNEGLERSTWNKSISDLTVRGIHELLDLIPEIDIQNQRLKASLLWESLADLENRRGSWAFLGEYSWSYFHESKTATFDAAFVRELNSTPWIPDNNGELQCPEFILFESLGWKANPFLQSKIHFKSPIIETLAKEAGLEPGMLDLLKKLGVTSEAELRSRLGINEQTDLPGEVNPGNVNDALGNILGDTVAPTPPVPDPLGPEYSGTGSGMGTNKTREGGNNRGNGGSTDGGSSGDSSRMPSTGTTHERGTRSPGSKGGRPFISYIGAQPEEKEPDPDGLDQEARMAIEEKAIEFILTKEPQLKRTPAYNPGYDLFKTDENGQPVCWIEVKAMTGSLHDRPVGISHTQFEYAQKHLGNYWLYIVENTGDTDKMRLVRIQDPAGKAHSFTFDQGWLSIAEISDSNQDQELSPEEE